MPLNSMSWLASQTHVFCRVGGAHALVAFHYDPDARADALVNELQWEQLSRHYCV